MKAKWITEYTKLIEEMENISLIYEAINTVVQDEQGTKEDEIQHDIVIKELDKRILAGIIK